MDLLLAKKQLREQVLQANEALPLDYLAASNRGIAAGVFALPEYQHAACIFLFVGRSSEIDTMPIIEHAWQQGKRVGVPKCFSKGIMRVYEISSVVDLERSPYGILEPVDTCPEITKSKIDLALLPCVTANARLQRLGFGGGYYDRYLEDSTFCTCVLCREKLLTDEIPTAAHDQRPDMLLTEKRVVRGEQAL